MSIDDKFDLSDYSQRQAEHILSRYAKYRADTGKHMTMQHYLETVYIPLGHANNFHESYFRNYHGHRQEEKQRSVN